MTPTIAYQRHTHQIETAYIEITINNESTTNQPNNSSWLNQIKSQFKQNLPTIIALVGTVVLKISFDYFVGNMRSNYRPNLISGGENEMLQEFELVRIANCVQSALQNNQSYHDCR